MDTDASPLRVSMAIVYRDQSDIAVIKDVFGEALRSVALFTCKGPAALTGFLSTQTVRSCFIFVETGEILKEMQKKSRGTPYEDLLRKARNTVGKNASSVSQSSKKYAVYQVAYSITLANSFQTKTITSYRTSGELGRNYRPKQAACYRRRHSSSS